MLAEQLFGTLATRKGKFSSGSYDGVFGFALYSFPVGFHFDKEVVTE